MHWILIFVGITSPSNAYGVPNAAMQQFNTAAACVAAERYIEAQAQGSGNFGVTCLPMGELKKQPGLPAGRPGAK